MAIWLALAVLLLASVPLLRTALTSALEDASLTWTHRGLQRGAVLALAFHDGALMAGTPEGAFRSTDGGRTWLPLLELTREDPGRAAAIAPGRPTSIALGNERGLLLSGDDGATWSRPRLPDAQDAVRGVGLVQGGRVFAATESAIFASADGGQTWQRSAAGAPASPPVTFSVDPTTDSRILAGGDDGLLASSDSGLTWQRVAGWPADVQIRELVRRPTQQATLYATASGLGVGGLLVSYDGGVTWQRLGRGSLQTDHVNTLLVTDGALYAGARGVADTDVIGGVWVSQDDGRTWEQVKTKLSNTDVVSLALDPGPPRVLYAGSEGGVVFRYTLDAWWLRLIPLLPAIGLVEPLALGIALMLVALAFAGLRRKLPAQQRR